ncbi:tannase/feruloyl esterase family alpha/beta hydrolase [Marinimicrobium sp. ABcell2]|uniref:tannase/feruloyl esterase family alpha/beta hydrolase n=1 Tax=Marinimicrobium sp. ABcell2 TaxID=3069751 RepID=UPI0027B1E46A|nr:tannase/feruloyl esterase family alpha/beta hydrolase [Marinimicrobium sp. ABcell2]MDQ2076934.1 tannase/feruloyl esterase family alpha/beta hydrolase [Marinimicrobium sp. ABcell2]
MSLIAAAATTTAALASPEKNVTDFHRACSLLTNVQTSLDQQPLRVTKANFSEPTQDETEQQSLPAHCDVYGFYGERKGADDQPYAVKFHMRLPLDWNGGLFFQGGGGLNGNVGDATGPTGHGDPAIQRGYAVVSHDSGHDTTINSDPQRGGDAAFGFDFKARKNYAHASIESTHQAASILINALYGQRHEQSYFFGCSKGGQEGMIAAQRYPELFDGIVAIAPGISLPKAAVAQAWDTQVFAALMDQSAGIGDLANTFTDAHLRTASDAIIEACDELDGLNDGMIQNFPACTADKVYPALKARQCHNIDQNDCLSADQIVALLTSFSGVRNTQGEALYTSFPLDTGITDFGWRLWKLGNGEIPPLNVVLGMPALATVFSTPPRALDTSPENLFAQQLAYDFDRDVAAIFSTHADFPESAWQLMQATSTDLDAFKARGSKLILVHGVSDPVFSINDSINWWESVNERYEGAANDIVRLFPVPGMGHCQGGPATDQFDAFTALLDWVEDAQAPDTLIATAGDSTPWPGRERLLCAYPTLLHYQAEDTSAGKFQCR